MVLQMSITLKVIISAVCVAQCRVVMVSCSDSGLTCYTRPECFFIFYPCMHYICSFSPFWVVKTWPSLQNLVFIGLVFATRQFFA